MCYGCTSSLSRHVVNEQCKIFPAKSAVELKSVKLLKKFNITSVSTGYFGDVTFYIPA